MSTLSSEDIRRIGAVVRTVERQPRNAVPQWAGNHGQNVAWKILGKLDGNLTTGGTATLSVWWIDEATGNPADSGRNETVYDWFMESGDQIDAGTKVEATYFLDWNRFIVTAAGC